MTAPTTAWVLNLDAEIELSRIGIWLSAGRTLETFSYETPKPLQDLVSGYGQFFAAQLPTHAIVLTDQAQSDTLASVGVCWCPTPAAMGRLRRVGLEPAAAPSAEILLRVNHRKYCAALGQTLPEAQFVETVDEMNVLLSRPSPSGEWLCKRPLGFAGRGQRRIAANEGARAHSREDNQRWLNESVPHGGLQIEPCVTILSELSIHGLVKRNNSHVLGQLCQQHVDEHRAWSRASLAPPQLVSPAQRVQLFVEAERVALALANEGYFGPFSVDSYLWQDANGKPRLNPRSEINARMTMAYPIGMGASWHDDLVQAP
jgi:hypothetical protein